jgi:hypothetical protein
VRRRWTLLAVAVAALAVVQLAVVQPALASEWLPHPAGATWTYAWTDSVYSPAPTKEKVTVKSSKGSSFVLAWTTDDKELENPEDAAVSTGTVTFTETNSGVVNADWSSNAPPPGFPVMCASAIQCGNSLASTYYNIIWGSRSPTLAEPLLKGLTWAASGGVSNDVTSLSTYVRQERITVPAFSAPVLAARVRTEIAQTGALGDPYGSGIRTVWWVWGVGPVKMVFAHAGGGNAPVTQSVLQSTSLTPKPPPASESYFPLVKGDKARYRWTNRRHLKKPVVQTVTTTDVANSSARLDVASVSGPIKVRAAYGYTLRVDGLSSLWATTKSASLAKLPPLGPKALPPAKRRQFVTAFDLMGFGFNPILPAYPQTGDSWVASRSGRDFQVFGVTGSAKVLGVQPVKVPAGRFQALAIRTTLTQPGFPFGSGTRTSWFAPGRGLVKLVFRHGDGSVSEVDLLK